jgi:ornithine carbamoyltransferase
MRNLIRLSDYTKNDVKEIFRIADEIQFDISKYSLKGKTIVMFFPDSSIRTRVAFEKGINLLGGQSILFAPSVLDKKEEIKDVIGYLNNWADALIIRYKNIEMLDKIAQYSKVPVINAMTNVNHPCEMLTDLYSLSKIRKSYVEDNFLFVGGKGNIGLAWKEASELMGFSLEQSCPKGYEIEGISVNYNLDAAMNNKDIICTDSLSGDMRNAFSNYMVTYNRLLLANEKAVLNPCPPFFRGEEVSADAIDSKYFVGYEFKKYLLEIQQAIIMYNMLS